MNQYQQEIIFKEMMMAEKLINQRKWKIIISIHIQRVSS